MKFLFRGWEAMLTSCPLSSQERGSSEWCRSSGGCPGRGCGVVLWEQSQESGLQRAVQTRASGGAGGWWSTWEGLPSPALTQERVGHEPLGLPLQTRLGHVVPRGQQVREPLCARRSHVLGVTGGWGQGPEGAQLRPQAQLWSPQSPLPVVNLTYVQHPHNTTRMRGLTHAHTRTPVFYHSGFCV